MLPDVYCEGTPREIGFAHGQKAKPQILGSIAFYKRLFKHTSQLDWPAVRKVATDDFEPVIRANWPAYLEEMEGIADGAGLDLADIVALNVRTEIAFGMFSDACTSLSWKEEAGEFNYLAQNWDWMPAQKQNLIRLTLAQPSKPTIRIITEGGLIGKIGINSAGVGVCFNAIRAARAVDASRMPSHLGLRLALEQTTRDGAAAALRRAGGVAASCFMLVADRETGGVGLEWSSADLKVLEMGDGGRVLHTNHYVVEHPGVEDTKWLEDTNARLERIEELCAELERVKGRELALEDVKGLFADEKGAPKGICRSAIGEYDSATLFNIVMDLKNVKAYVRVGRPSDPADETFTLEF